MHFVFLFVHSFFQLCALVFSSQLNASTSGNDVRCICVRNNLTHSFEIKFFVLFCWIFVYNLHAIAVSRGHSQHQSINLCTKNVLLLNRIVYLLFFFSFLNNLFLFVAINTTQFTHNNKIIIIVMPHTHFLRPERKRNLSCC